VVTQGLDVSIVQHRGVRSTCKTLTSTLAASRMRAGWKWRKSRTCSQHKQV